MNTAAYTDSVTRLRAEFYATTKQTAGAPGANMTGACYMVSDGVYDNKNGVVTFASQANGGAANPMPGNPNEMTLEPQSCDSTLASGGLATIQVAWTVTGGTTARLVITNGNALNTAQAEIDIYQRRKLA